jgi:hypothetical protein
VSSEIELEIYEVNDKLKFVGQFLEGMKDVTALGSAAGLDASTGPHESTV